MYLQAPGFGLTEYAAGKDTQPEQKEQENLFLLFGHASVFPYAEDALLNLIRRTFYLFGEVCERLTLNPDLSCGESQLSGILLLRDKLLELRKWLLTRALVHNDEVDPVSPPSLHSWALLEIDRRFVLLSSTIENALQQRQQTNYQQVSPMGLDLLNRLRHFFSGKEAKGTTKPPSVGNNDAPIASDLQQASSLSARKRRYQEDGAHLIKYRRVDNTFPKFITNEAAAEDYGGSSSGYIKSMAERERLQDVPPPTRRSIFNAPHLTQTRVRSSQSIMVDLSDDEEQQQAHPQSSIYESFASARTSAAPSSYVRPQMLYSDAVRLGQNGFGSVYHNGHPSHDTSADSLLLHEEQRSEHEQYLSLINNLSLMGPRTFSKPQPPPLQRIHQQNSRDNGWFQPKQQRSLNNVELTDYAKLLANKQQQQQKQQLATPPPPALMRCPSVNSATSHASTIHSSQNSVSTSSCGSSSSSGSSSSTSSNSEKEKPAVVIELDDSNEDEADKAKNSSDSSPCTLMLQHTEALQRRFRNCKFFKNNFEEQFNQKNARMRQEADHGRELALIEAAKSTEKRRIYEQGLRENISKYRMTHKPIFVLEGFNRAAVEDKEPEFLPFTEELQKRYHELVQGPPQQVLVSKFSLNITRNDIRTLTGSMWLNDEVINFYMNLLTDRSQRREGQLPSVYAMNTFFVPRLLQNGYAGVKRWTRKVDIFSKDIIPVPVHVGGVHWCMAIIHIKQKTIRYYDSMGKPNQQVLMALEMYLREESLDKRKQVFDTSGFQIENVPNVPQQANGSDCGVFSCMFAEYITRDKPLNFSQEHMEYFRKKMILEICGGELWK